MARHPRAHEKREPRKPEEWTHVNRHDLDESVLVEIEDERLLQAHTADPAPRRQHPGVAVPHAARELRLARHAVDDAEQRADVVAAADHEAPEDRGTQPTAVRE